MNLKPVAKIEGGQDGAVWKDYLLRFDHEGHCCVYHMIEIEESEGGVGQPMAAFCLDMAERLKPHCNSVMFGNEYYSPEDEFPLLYTNIYNSYAGGDDPMKGVCTVYRIQRNGAEFSSTLVQIVVIGFVEDCRYWKSWEQKEDIRPFGNFTIDREEGIYYAFTMRDKSKTTRYFAFDLPKLIDGVMDGTFHVRRVTLNIGDIKTYFDCQYHHFVQGACFRGGKIYSLEGFTGSGENPPALRVIDVKSKQQVFFADLAKLGGIIEPEMIDFKEDVCYYSDNYGSLFIIDF